MANTNTANHLSPGAPSSNTVFEYIGKTALTVTGGFTGRRYRFNRPGDLQSIDPRDISSVINIPVIKQR
ncbi:hypothetical protein I5907_03375 [Panacibacter sp. DH6]|uniref:Uncharacterized protein n=1 Tax=Panacibacter microcysteis TaxID=2793269 RepID=A0A931E346_9BACT|nr:hypothetical protein [Panacibacter microcysteis]MBG9375257.1 hypothetical protein [Panacibacter microcysteis]